MRGGCGNPATTLKLSVSQSFLHFLKNAFRLAFKEHTGYSKLA